MGLRDASGFGTRSIARTGRSYGRSGAGILARWHSAPELFVIASDLNVCEVFVDKKVRNMVLQKLQEALTEVREQRKVLEEIEQQLGSMISRLSGGSGTGSLTEPAASANALNNALTQDDSVKVEVSYSDLPIYSELRRSSSI